ncbi:MAG: metallophosphoesterase [Bacteroidales bacterium]|nr:metallophosphoesterase [Bacteroidales bacterium]
MLLVILIVTEILTFSILIKQYKGRSKTKYYISMIVNTILSIYLWMHYIEISSWKGFPDYPYNIWLRMNLNAAFCAILFPRILLIILHFTGVLINIKQGGYSRGLTSTGLIIWIVVLVVVITGSIRGRFNVKTEFVTVYKEGLHSDLEGFTIALISDLHLAGFYGRENFIKKQMDEINSYSPDIIVNSGDFISYGWQEYGRMDTILSHAEGRLGNFAVFGNHDMGFYHPLFTYAERESHILKMRELIKNSGYHLLIDENDTIKKGDAVVAIAGITTNGRHGHIKYGNLQKAIQGTSDADLTILISHDPNHWEKQVKGKTSVDITLAGHTHGMQTGIRLENFRWSPSKYFYPCWNGLYKEGNQYLYVNRGFGVLSMPFRIGMPPEITIIKMTGSQ